MDYPEFTFESADAKFGPSLSDNGLFGRYVLSNPEDGCQKIQRAPFEPYIVGNRTVSPILLIKRGTCEFDLKVHILS